MHSITIENLNWSYDQKEILKDISLKIKGGLFTGIIGPNGSGKTTMAKLLSKLLKTSKKTIFINNEDLSEIKIAQLAKSMAMVPQTTNITYDLTAYEVVLLGRTPHLKRFQQESHKDYEIVKAVMEETDTWQYKDRLIHQLSGGERQRVIIARALAQEPEVLILDEPVTYLDVHHQIQVMTLIKQLSETRNMTIVTILHDLNYALKYCDQVMMLHDGKVFKYGEPTEVVTKENILHVYDLDVSILEHPVTQLPLVVF
ncbi:MAG: ABC transporter ATP-binding protein [Clostridia bacterium]|nr:ABC transporter ATP-binding protein [Clostridia bacterium]